MRRQAIENMEQHRLEQLEMIEYFRDLSKNDSKESKTYVIIENPNPNCEHYRLGQCVDISSESSEETQIHNSDVHIEL